MSESLDEVTFTGRFPNGCDVYSLIRTALSHNEFVFGLFSQMWRQSGGTLDGTYHNVVLPEDEEPLLSFRSLPLTDVIARINKHSNNLMARQLLYTLAAETNGPPGTEADGKAVILEWLARNGLASEHTQIENGAGLSRQTRTPTSDMTTMLSFACRLPYMPEYLASMSLYGLDGTLRRRFSACWPGTSENRLARSCHSYLRLPLI